MRVNNIFLSISATLAIASMTGCSGGSDSSNTSSVPSAPIIEVETAKVISDELPTYLEVTGNLSGDEQSDVAPAIGGKIAEVRFDIGSFVKKGELLVRLDSKDAEIRLDQSKKAVDQAVANLRQTQSRLGVVDGEVFDIERFSQVRSVRAQLDLAEKELERATRLRASGDISQSAFDMRKSQRDALLGQLDEARSNAAVAVKAIETARAAVVAAQAQVATAEKFLTDTNIFSPITGYVAERNADVGEFISPNVPNSKLATIVNTNRLRMRLEIPEKSIANLSRGQSTVVQVVSFPGKRFEGRIVRIAPMVNVASRLLIAEAEIDNADGLLRPGQFATARITQASKANALLIPSRAVRTDGNVNKIFIVNNGVVSERIVQLGLSEGDSIEVKRGASANEIVAVSNITKLGEGMSVKVK